jgi:SpoIIAA-like
MPIQYTESNQGRTLEVLISGKMTHADYERFVPEFERLIALHGKIRVLFEMGDFHGWEGAALWDEVKFDVRHYSDIERIAAVGEKRWEQGISLLFRPCTGAELRYFDRSAIAEARAWLAS